MAETYMVDLVNTAWTDISQGNSDGFISNQGTARIMLYQADTQPSDTIEISHPLESIDGINMSKYYLIQEVI